MFKENSWYFRNALVRACYENPLKGVGQTFEPLERFFRNLLLGERHELKNRYLRVDLCKRQEAELKAGRRGAEQRSEKSGQKRRSENRRAPMPTAEGPTVHGGEPTDGDNLATSTPREA